MLIKNTFLFAVTAVLLGACTTDPNSPGLEYMPDMYRSPAIEAYVDYGMDPYHYGEAQYDSLNSRISARKPVAGSIAYVGDMMQFNMPYPIQNTPEGYEQSAVLESPLATSKSNIEKGKEIYTKMCTHCHGEAGAGDGAISRNGFIKGIPDYAGKLADLPEGKMFHSITYGKGLMGSHASQLNQLERWQVIQYVQVLQNGGSMPEFDAEGNVTMGDGADAQAEGESAAETIEG